jgi:hypothetical protein
MKPTRFDALAGSLASPTSRRALVRRAASLGVVVLGRMALLDPVQARKRKRSGQNPGDLCASNGSQCKKKSKKCKAGNCLHTPFTIEARWSNPASDHDTYVFMPNVPGASVLFPFFSYTCNSDDAGAGGLEPFAFVDRDAEGPGDEITTVAFLLDGKYEYWIELAELAPARDLTVTLRTATGRGIRSWNSPANPSPYERGWHVFDIQGERKSITSVDRLIADPLPFGAHAVATRVCPKP